MTLMVKKQGVEECKQELRKLKLGRLSGTSYCRERFGLVWCSSIDGTSLSCFSFDPKHLLAGRLEAEWSLLQTGWAVEDLDWSVQLTGLKARDAGTAIWLGETAVQLDS